MNLIHMPKHVIDSYAWIEYFTASIKGEIVKKIIESPANEIITPTIVMAEVISITKRENRDTDTVYKNLIGLSKIYDFDLELAKEVGILHAEIRRKISDFGMADTVILLTARKLGAKVVTGDPHFKDFKEVIMI